MIRAIVAIVSLLCVAFPEQSFSENAYHYKTELHRDYCVMVHDSVQVIIMRRNEGVPPSIMIEGAAKSWGNSDTTKLIQFLVRKVYNFEMPDAELIKTVDYYCQNLNVVTE